MFNLNNISHVEVLHFWTGFGAADAIWEFEIWQASLDLWSYYQRFQINAQIKQQVWDLKPGPIPVGINVFCFFFHGIHWPSVETKCVLYFVTKRVKSKRIFSSQILFSLEKSHNLELQDLQNPFVLSWRNKMSPNTNIPINFMCHISGIKIFFWLWFKNIAKICNNLEEKQLLPGEYANFLQNWALI